MEEKRTKSGVDNCKDEFPANDGLERRRPIINGEHLDIEAYAALYSGRTKISRLRFIAENCGVPSMELEALRMAYDQTKKGGDTQVFRAIVAKIDGRLGEAYGPDDDWANAVDRRVEIRKEKLENDINSYRINLIKESIREGYSDMADFFYEHGYLGDAFKNYIRSRDYCSSSKHNVHMCMNAILVSIEMNQFANVRNYVNKAKLSQDALDPVTIAKLCCAAGLSYLHCKEYKQAARQFLETEFELGNNYTEVIAPQDVATYGGLCALASFNRAELKGKVIDNINFRNFLELVPEMRELINDFYTSCYASCFECLGSLRANFLLDIHLQKHVETLYQEIRSRALIQYTLPFVSIDLRVMANAFKTTVAGLERELEGLITNNRIQARIDSHNKILYARHADQRKGTFQRVLQTADEFDRAGRAMLLRASLIKRDYNVKASRTR